MRTLAAVAAIALVAAPACAGSSDDSVSPAPTSPPISPSARPTTAPSATPSVSPSDIKPSSSPPSPPTTLPQWLAGDVVGRLPTTRRVVALTFDGGAGAQAAARIVATLVTDKVPATFFLTGQFVRANAGLVESLVAQGFVVGNHTMAHPHLGRMSAQAIRDEINAAARAITDVTGTSTKPWFRFPFGEYDGEALRVVHALGYGAIGWTVDSRGWQGRAAGDVEDVVGRVRAAIGPGAIVLMHLGANPQDGTTFDADALPAVIAAIRAAGYGFVTVAEGDLQARPGEH